MTDNTENATASSPPSFMAEGGKAVKAAEKAEKSEAKEEAAQNNDDRQKRKATIEKATFRTTELAGYVAIIEKAVGQYLPQMIAKNPFGEVIDTLVPFEDAVEELDTRLKTLKAHVSMAREVLLPERMDADESKTVTTETGHRVTRTGRIFASIITSKMEQAYAWLRNNELGPLIKETVNSSSLSAAAKELIENGKELPEDLFRTHTKDGVSITKKKAK